MSFFLTTATQITQSTHTYVRNLWTLSMKTAELILGGGEMKIVLKDLMKWFDKRSLEVVGMFNSEMAYSL